jgi:ribosome biogenesis GTPase
MSADRDFNLARLERYLALIFVQNIVPVVFLNKTDLIDKDTLNWLEADLFKRHPGLTVFSGSVLKEEGLKAFADGLTPGRSFCVVGSSGVGKSSLINYLAQNEVERIKEIGAGTQRGRHSTTSGHMHILDKGAILIDTPGLREVGLTDAEDGIKKAFAEIEELAMNCRFSDCKHQSEPGCAVQEALSEGRILPEKFSNYQKLKREAERFGQTIADKRKKEKSFGRMVKEVKKMKKNKL